jgi:hypothetical protein
MLEELNLWNMKEEIKEFYYVTLKLPLRPLGGVPVTRRKMATPQERAQVVVWYAEMKSLITVQRNYRRVYGGDVPDTKNVKAWFDKFLATGKMYSNSLEVRGTIIGPFFFVEATVTGSVYLDMFVQFVYPQVADLQPNIIYQQDGASPHWSLYVRETLTRTFPDRWIGRDGLISWPPRSPDITPLDFFFWV